MCKHALALAAYFLLMHAYLGPVQGADDRSDDFAAMFGGYTSGDSEHRDNVHGDASIGHDPGTDLPVVRAKEGLFGASFRDTKSVFPNKHGPFRGNGRSGKDLKSVVPLLRSKEDLFGAAFRDDKSDIANRDDGGRGNGGDDVGVDRSGKEDTFSSDGESPPPMLSFHRSRSMDLPSAYLGAQHGRRVRDSSDDDFLNKDMRPGLIVRSAKAREALRSQMDTLQSFGYNPEKSPMDQDWEELERTNEGNIDFEVWNNWPALHLDEATELGMDATKPLSRQEWRHLHVVGLSLTDGDGPSISNLENPIRSATQDISVAHELISYYENHPDDLDSFSVPITELF